MSEVTASTLKDKLKDTINKRMRLMKQKKTNAVTAIAKPLGINSRQIYKWLREESFPHNAANIVLSLDTMIDEMEKYKSDVQPPTVLPPAVTFPFKITIQKDSVKISKESNGDINIRGLLSLDL